MLIIIVLFLLAIGFGFQNAGETATIKLFKTTFIDVPLVWIVLASFALGMIVSFLIAVTYYFKVSSEARTQKREARRLQEEITALRNRQIEQIDIEESEKE
jgi:uncharacterized membrane protein YciS (DUF1049 family)